MSLLVAGAAAAYFCILLILYGTEDWHWGLPALITAIFNIIAGVFVLRNRSLLWFFAGLFIAFAAFIYFFILLLAISWAMA